MTLTDMFLGDEAEAMIVEWSVANAKAPPDLAYAIALVAVANTGTTPGTISLTVSGAPVAADGYRWFPVEVNETGDAGFVVEDYLLEP